MAVVTINKENFNTEVQQASQTVLIDLWASWCGPCRMLSPIVEEVAKDHPEVKVCKINVDEQQELAQAFQVSAIPMLVVMKNGKVTSTAVGLQPKSKVEAML